MDLPRRRMLLALAAMAGGVALEGCASKQPAHAPPPRPPDRLHLSPLEALAAAAGLEWIVIAEPQTILGAASLKQGLDKLFPEFRLEAFEHGSAINVRALDRVVVASYPNSVLFLLSGVKDPREAERRFRARLMTDIVRLVQREDAALVTGRLGSGQRRGMVALLPQVVGLESGDVKRAKAAYLHALGKLKRSPSALEAPGVPALVKRLGNAPLLGFAPGPFEGEWKQGLHGLLAAATAVGAAVRVTPVGTLQASFVIEGEWGPQAEAASQHLARSWKDIANSGFGKLTGLHELEHPPLPTHADDAVSLTVEANAERFLDGLRAAVSAQISEIMQ